MARNGRRIVTAMSQVLLASAKATLKVTLSAGAVNASNNTSTVTTVAVTAASSNGTGPFTYSWGVANQVGSLLVQVSTPAAQTTTFRMSGSSSGDSATGDATCTVTDANGLQGVSPICTVSIVHP